MGILTRAALAANCLILGLSAKTAFGDGGIAITILNNTDDALLVTVYDQSTKPGRPIVADQAVYGNASVSVSIAPDGTGLGHLRWTAVTKDGFMRACGHGDRAGLHDGDTVNVGAKDQCPNSK